MVSWQKSRYLGCIAPCFLDIMKYPGLLYISHKGIKQVDCKELKAQLGNFHLCHFGLFGAPSAAPCLTTQSQLDMAQKAVKIEALRQGCEKKSRGRSSSLWQ